MQETYPVSVLVNRLADFPLWLKQRLGAEDVDWCCKPAEGEWCLTEVMCHLRDVELEVHQPRFEAIQANPGAFLPGAVADEWVEERAYFRQHGPTALAQFADARAETLELLPAPSSVLWQRQGEHSFFGPTTMHELLNLVVQHDQAHREQVAKLLDGLNGQQHSEAY
jgi:hypothetical protein